MRNSSWDLRRLRDTRSTRGGVGQFRSPFGRSARGPGCGGPRKPGTLLSPPPGGGGREAPPPPTPPHQGGGEKCPAQVLRGCFPLQVVEGCGGGELFVQ